MEKTFFQIPETHCTITLYHFSQKLYDTSTIVCLQGLLNHIKVSVVSIFWLLLLDDEWHQMWYNSILLYLYLEVINYSFSPIFLAPSNQFSASILQKIFFVLSGTIYWLHIILWGGCLKISIIYMHKLSAIQNNKYRMNNMKAKKMRTFFIKWVIVV